MRPSLKTTERAAEAWLVRIAEKIHAGEYATALAELLPLVQSPAVTPQILEFTIICFWELRDDQTALDLSDVATQRFPECAPIWSQRGNLALNTGDHVLAQACFRSALQLSPKDLHSLIALNTLDVFKKGSKYDQRLRHALKSKRLSKRELAATHTAVAQVEQHAGRCKRAFFHFKSANEVNSGNYYPEDMQTLVNAQKAQFQPTSKPAMAGKKPPLIFIGGMPRSGTTLVEAVLSRHPDVRCIGESSALKETLKNARRMAARVAKPKTEWDWYKQLSETQIAKLRKDFSESVGLNSGDNRCVVDKMPLNCLDFGLAHLLFPDARFVHMLRHPLDCGWSNYVTHFKVGNGFSTRLDWIGHLIRITHESALDYETKLGTLFRFQSYKALVKDPETQIRNLLGHVDLDWSVECLNPEKSHRVQRTASMLQVRKPINVEALGKSRSFEQHLSPLIAAIGGQSWLDEWEAFDEQIGNEPIKKYKPLRAVS